MTKNTDPTLTSSDSPSTEEDTIIFNYDDGTQDAITFPAGTIDFLQGQAAAKGITLDALVAEAVRSYVKIHTAEDSAKE